MKTKEFDYLLPEELIAQTPIPDRDRSRLLVVNRKPEAFYHGCFRDIVNYVESGDVLVVNNTRVIPARLFGRRKTGGSVEVLLLNSVEPDVWECLVRPGRKIKPGEKIFIGDGSASDMVGTVESRTAFGGRLIRWEYQGEWEDVLKRAGHIPLPPYIKTRLDDSERYQTVYSQVPGSAAAPTAGLHFTPELLKRLVSKGVTIVPVTLNVGLGTFRPVTADNVEEHKMHKEYFEIAGDTASVINEAKGSGHRIFAVGTTVVRVLEFSCCSGGLVRPQKGTTNLFIYPGYEFKVVDCMVTNFHLPKSTLLMMVCAFAGKQLIMEAYKEAIGERYRFFSFGDAMLIL